MPRIWFSVHSPVCLPILHFSSFFPPHLRLSSLAAICRYFIVHPHPSPHRPSTAEILLNPILRGYLCTHH